MNTQRLIEILEDHDLDTSMAENETEIVIACPLCFDENKKLYIQADTGAWICFRCDARGGLRTLLLEVCEMSSNDAYPTEMALLAGRKQVTGLIVSKPPPASSVTLPKTFLEIAGSPQTNDQAAAAYLLSRGIDRGIAREVGIGFCLVGYYKYRIIVPVRTQGALRTFVARSWLPAATKKVLMPAGSQAERALFGYDGLDGVNLVNWTDLILVEGVFDALAMWKVGYRETIATLGAHVTELQRNLVKRLRPRHVILLRDGDDAGRAGALKDGKGLAEFMLSVRIAHLPGGTDPGSASPSEIKHAIDNARSVTTHSGAEAMKEVQHG